MGQKVNPIGLRLGINRTCLAGDKEYGKLLHKDLELRKYLNKRLSQAGISKIIIERMANKARVTINTARPGMVIGKKGADIEKLRADQSVWGLKSASTSLRFASLSLMQLWQLKVSLNNSSAACLSVVR